jgi:hypothetical protein
LGSFSPLCCHSLPFTIVISLPFSISLHCLFSLPSHVHICHRYLRVVIIFSPLPLQLVVN